MANPKLSKKTKHLRGSLNVTREKTKPTTGATSKKRPIRDKTGFDTIANEWAASVIERPDIACQWVRLAAKRQLTDLQRQGRKDFPFVFSSEHANRICNFMRQLPHIKGEWAKPKGGKVGRIELEDWQVFNLAVPFGWVHRKTGRRRFRTCYTEEPRKNAKSTMTAGVGLYMILEDGEPGAEAYSAATTRDQARIVWADAKRMVDRSGWMRERYGVEALARSIFVEETASSFQPLSADANSLDGLNVHFGGIDELHAHKTRDVWDVMETATGSRSQPLIWTITTAGTNRIGICYEQRNYLTRILEGIIEDDSYFGIIFTIDEGDDWRDPASWRKANPNFGISVSAEDLARKARKAQETPAAVNNFLTKHLNVWVNAGSPLISAEKWQACTDLTMAIDDFTGHRCWIALDLASKVDIAAKVYLFEDGHRSDGRPCIALFCESFVPESALEESANSAQYAGWEQKGFLRVTPGEIIDFEEIEDGMIDEDRARFDIVEVPYDPFQATRTVTRLMKEGFPMVEVGATVKNFSDPLKEFIAMIVDGRIRHDGNEVFTWMVLNMVGHYDQKDNVYPRKEFPEQKIDGGVAAIMAIARWLCRTDQQSGSPFTRL